MNKDEEKFSVSLHNEKIGRIYRKGDVTRFVFSENYWAMNNRPVLGLAFEDNPKGQHRSHIRLPAWFSNLLPEGRLRQWIADARKVSVQREMELLAQVGHDLPGAVQIYPDEFSLPMEFLVEDGGKSGVHVGDERLWTFSLAGVGLKFSMVYHGDRLTIPAHGDSGDWIVKLPDPVHSGVPHNEFAMMTLARIVGIDVPEFRLVHRDELLDIPRKFWPSNEDWAYAIKRFDRTEEGGRVHIEDLAQVRNFYPEDKYRGSFETIASLIFRGRDKTSLVEFARRMAFNVIIGNGDAHLKNWSLIYYNGSVPTLSPAYDLVSTFSYRPLSEGPEDIGLRFGRTKRFDLITLEHFKELDGKLGAEADLQDVAQQVLEKMKQEWGVVEELLENHRDLMNAVRSFSSTQIERLSKR